MFGACTPAWHNGGFHMPVIGQEADAADTQVASAHTAEDDFFVLASLRVYSCG